MDIAQDAAPRAGAAPSLGAASSALHDPERSGMRVPASPSSLGSVALVTGATRGIGAGIARALAEAGWRVAIGYRERGAQAAALAR